MESYDIPYTLPADLWKSVRTSYAFSGDGEVKNELSFYEYRIRAYVYDGGRIPPSLVARKNG